MGWQKNSLAPALIAPISSSGARDSEVRKTSPARPCGMQSACGAQRFFRVVADLDDGKVRLGLPPRPLTR